MRPDAGRAARPARPDPPLTRSLSHARRRRILGTALVAASLCAGGCRGKDPALGAHPLSSWRVALSSVSAPDRRAACDALAHLGPEASPAVPALVARLSDPAPDVARAAARALVAVGPDAIAPLERALDVHAPPLSRLFAAHALVQLVPGHDWATSVLLESFGATSDPPLAAEAHRLVVTLGEPFAPRIGALLDDPYVPLRVQALHALGDMGRRAEGQLARVLSALSSPEASVRLAAADAAGMIGPRERVLGPLRRTASDPDPGVAAAAAAALGRLRL